MQQDLRLAEHDKKYYVDHEKLGDDFDLNKWMEDQFVVLYSSIDK